MVRKDIEIDEDFFVKKEFPSVSGRDEFHQSIAIRLKERVREIERGAGLNDEAESKLRLAASRVAREHDYIDEISSIFVSLNANEPSTITYSIDYKFDETYTEMI